MDDLIDDSDAMGGLTKDRHLSLRYALDLHGSRFTGDDNANRRLATTATVIYDWLQGPFTLALSVKIRDTTTSQLITETTGGRMAQITTAQHAEATVQVFDRGGFGIPDRGEDSSDNVTWALESNSGVVALTISEDTRTARLDPVAIGSDVLRVTYPAPGGDKTGTVAVDVINSEADRVEVTLTPIDNESASEQPGEPA